MTGGIQGFRVSWYVSIGYHGAPYPATRPSQRTLMDGYRLAVARGAVWRSRSDQLMAARSNRMSRRIKTAEAYSRGSADDLFAALAPLLRVRPVLEDFCRFGGPWRAPHEAAGNGLAYFHIVTRGS